MSVFQNFVENLAEAGFNFDRTARKIELLREYSIADYRIACGEAELQEMTESVSASDALEICYEARNALNKKNKELIRAMERNSEKYFKATKAAVDKMMDKNYDEVLKRAEDLCKDDPQVAKTKVEVDDYDDEIKVISSGIEEAEKLEAKILAKKTVTDADKKKLDQIVNDVNIGRQRSGGKKKMLTAIAVVSTLATLLIIIKKNADKNSKPDDYGIQQDISNLDPESASYLIRLRGTVKAMKKKESAVSARYAVSLRNGLSKLFGRRLVKSTRNKRDMMEESTATEISVDELEPIVFEEATDVSALLEDIVEEVQAESLYDDTTTLNESAESEERTMYGYDIEDLLNEVAYESGLDDGYSDYVNDDEIEAILEATAEECGLNGDDSVDSLLDNFTEAMDL